MAYIPKQTNLIRFSSTLRIIRTLPAKLTPFTMIQLVVKVAKCNVTPDSVYYTLKIINLVA